MKTPRKIVVKERPEVPWLGIIFGYGPMVPFVSGGIASWCLSGFWRQEVVTLTLVWAVLILAFLSGVRRGVSFRTEDGPAVMQIVTMLFLFVLALAAAVAGLHGLITFALVTVLSGFLAIMLLDPVAARQGQAPLFFARLRPPQMAVAVTGLAALLLNVFLRA